VTNASTDSERTVGAGLWTVGGKLVARCFDFLTLIVLARLLAPDDFGLIAMAMSTVVIAEAVLEMPVSSALLRRGDLSPPMLDTAFTVGILRGVALAVLLGALSFPLALFYGEPRLTILICALSLAPILRGTMSPRMVFFVQKLDFKREVFLELVGKIAAFVVASLIAVWTESYWAIAAATITSPLVGNALSYVFAPYAPRLSLSQWRHFADILGWNTLSQLLAAVNWQIDRVLMGRYVSRVSLGRFSVANDLVGIPIQSIVNPLLYPLMPSFVPLVGTNRLGSAYCKASNAIFLMAAPVFLTMHALADPIVRIILGEGWGESASVLRWMSLIVILTAPCAPLAPLALALNRMRMVTFRTAIEFIFKAPILFFAVTTYGVMGAVAGHGAVAIVVFLATLLIVKSMTGLSVFRQLAALWRTVVALAALAATLYLLRPPTDGSEGLLMLTAHMLAAAGAGAIVYGLVVLALWRAMQCPPGVEKIAMTHAARLFSKRLSTPR